jgi:tRNA G18 (ribose-2'-O)-methylase SpoU
MRGYFGIGILDPKTTDNIGTLWRSANLFGAAFIFTIGGRYKKQPTDTMQTWRHIPLHNYATFELFYNSMPYNCKLIGVELDEKSVPISKFVHPERAIYLLGAEDHGLTKEAITCCHHIIQLPGEYSMNVAVAGSIALYDRINKLTTP